MTPRIPLPDDAALDDAVRAQLARRPPIGLYRMAAHAPGLLAPFMSLVAANFGALQITPELREVLILRVARHHRSDYEAHHHRSIARRVGLAGETVDGLLGAAVADPAWGEAIVDAAAFADHLLDGAPLPDDLVRRVTARHGHRGFVEMALVVGFYRMVATFIAATGLAPEDHDVVSGWQPPASGEARAVGG